MSTQFEKELSSLINKYSGENCSDTPDYILADYLGACLAAFNKASVWRKEWFSPHGVKAEHRDDGPTISRL